jgi:hypothetical protein
MDGTILYSGKKGRGKSLLAVINMIKGDWHKKYFIFHNIDDLDHKRFEYPDQVVDWKRFCEQRKIDPDSLFDRELWIKIGKWVLKKYDKPILLIVDEAVNWFESIDKNKLGWLAYTRHIPMDVIFIPQHKNMMHYKYRYLVDSEVRAKFKLGPMFIYGKSMDGESAGFMVKFAGEKVYSAYKSAEKMIKRPFPYHFVIVGLLILVFGYVAFDNMFDKDAKKAHAKLENTKKNMSTTKIVDTTRGAPKNGATTYSTATKYGGFTSPPVASASVPQGLPSYINSQWAYAGRINEKVLLKNILSGEYYNLNDIYPFCEILQITSSRVVIEEDKIKMVFLQRNTDRTGSSVSPDSGSSTFGDTVNRFNDEEN